MAGTSLENVTAIENGRNLYPTPDVIAGLSRAMDLLVEDIYAAITGTLEDFLWEKPREIGLRDAELEPMFRQVDSLLEGKIEYSFEGIAYEQAGSRKSYRDSCPSSWTILSNRYGVIIQCGGL